ncbi:dCMP hydroxymethylase [Klebsiella phage PKO111]|uniref:dCMP hydroxymethylase n=1 Tax=Klebsiella phage PKO111 TaxID=1654928 RepID=A0A159B7V1_9CAUD|nr:thymidylate synthase [Klebsiella phage PKO111]AKJ73159.1 dCMP hydroxymethylase [Klebsiella phage PKO111]
MIVTPMTVQDIRQEFADALLNKEFVIDKTGVKTIEIVGASFIADEPLIFGAVNDGYIARELEWYKSQSLFVKDIPGETPAIWKAIASKHGEINSNYGWAVWSTQNYSQFANCAKELINNPDSRRGIMIYTRPQMQYDFERDGMSDFMCTNNVQYLIRDNKVHAVVNMRSNDVVFGYRNDYAWQLYVLEQLTKLLNASGKNYSVGDIIWNVGSLHVYERHLYLVDNYAYTGETHIAKKDYKGEWK